MGEGRSLGWGGGDHAGPGDGLRGSGMGAGFGRIVRVQVADGKAHVWSWGPQFPREANVEKRLLLKPMCVRRGEEQLSVGKH